MIQMTPLPSRRRRPPGPGPDRAAPGRSPNPGASPRSSAVASSLRILLFLVVGVAVAPPAAAQEMPLERPELPGGIVAAAVAFYNDSATVRFPVPSRLPQGSIIRGRVASLGGPFVVGGRIEGDLLVINGDLRFEPGGRVDGDVVVVGGRVLAQVEGSIGGTVEVHETPLTYTFRGEGIAFVERGRRDGLSSPLGFGRSRFTLRAGRNYNRIEGLPVVFGPILETSARNPLRLEALGVWRTESGFDLQGSDLGYTVRLEQSMGGRDELGIGFGVRSEIVPIEAWGVSDLEASLATFILHRDFRDYLEERGWNSFLQWRPRAIPLSVTWEYREARHRFVAPGGPWSLKDNDLPWRPQPATAEGELRSLGMALRVDTRNDVRAPTDGWLATLAFRRGLGGISRIRPSSPSPVRGRGPTPSSNRGSGGTWTGPSPTARRTSASTIGSVPAPASASGRSSPGRWTGPPWPPSSSTPRGGGLPSRPQSPLPGLRCTGHRAWRGEPADPPPSDPTPVHPGYGCDRMVLLQAEFRAGLPVEIPRDSAVGNLLGLLELTPGWSLFVDAGRGWSNSRGENASGAFRGEGTGWRSDAGAGLSLGHLSAQVAFPLQGVGRRATFSVRLNQRF
jgi:hypothetical protein